MSVFKAFPMSDLLSFIYKVTTSVLNQQHIVIHSCLILKLSFIIHFSLNANCVSELLSYLYILLGGPHRGIWKSGDYTVI